MRHYSFKSIICRRYGFFNLTSNSKDIILGDVNSTFFSRNLGRATYVSDMKTRSRFSAVPMKNLFFNASRSQTSLSPVQNESLPYLPVVNAVLENALLSITTSNLKKTAIVYIHHPLRTSINLVSAMIQLGAQPKNIFILGKHYSECSSVVEELVNLNVNYQRCSTQIGLGRFSHNFIRDINWLWKNLLTQLQKDDEVKEILILDHGGHALTFIPEEILQKYKVVGVEKTTGGLINLETQGLPPFPLISVANCAAKKILESPLIAEAVVTKLLPLIPIKNKDLICGVVGYGAIGKAIVAKLLSMGHKVIVYDSNMQQLTNIKSSREITITNELSALVAFADYIFGCTGRDITTSTDLFRLSPKNKTLISCSSEDKEFLSLLHTIQRTKSGKSATQPLQDIEYINEAGGIIRILRGGFPINFDNSGESVPSQDIQLTRALVLGSILQAIQFFKNPEILNTHFIYSLDSTIQKFIVSEWLKHQSSNRFSGSVIESFQNTKWIAENSGGLCVDSFPNNQLKSNLTNPSSLFRLKNKVLITRHVILQPNLSYSK